MSVVEKFGSFFDEINYCFIYHPVSHKTIGRLKSLFEEAVEFTKWTSGPYFIKVKIILSLRFKINLIFYLIKEFMKNSCFNFFYEIVCKISIKVKRNSKFKEFAKT